MEHIKIPKVRVLEGRVNDWKHVFILNSFSSRFAIEVNVFKIMQLSLLQYI